MQANFRNILYLFAALCILSLLPSCRVAKNLPEGQTLLVKNKLVLQTKAKGSEREKLREDLAQIAAQKPNKKILGFMPVRMWFYHSATRAKKLTRFRQWIIDKVGEAPVVYDSTLLSKSEASMEYYLFNSGYFHNDVTDTVITKKRRTTIVYTIKAEESWKIDEVELPKGKTVADSIVRAKMKGTFLRKGERFDIVNLKNERDRIETVLRNSGFYFFNREYITYEFDSISATRKVNIKINLNPPTDSTEHERYYINDIYIITDYSTELLNDSTKRDTVTQNEYKFISQKMNFRNGVLTDAVFFRQNDLYSKENELRTLNRFALLGTFKFISIEFSKGNRTDNYLDCHIYLTPAKRQSISYTAETNVTNEGLFGLAGSLGYKNKNLSKRADQLLFDVSAGVQLKFSTKKTEKKVQIITATTSASLTYYMNKFLVPFRAKAFSRNTNPRTRFNATYNFEHRFDFDTLGRVVFLYQLHQFNFSFGYEWKENNFKQHLFNPLAVSFYLLPIKGDEFAYRLKNNPFLRSSFEEQVILGPNYTFTYNSQRSNQDKVTTYFRTNIETAGNVLYAGYRLANLKSDHDSVYLIAKRPFSQYFRIDADLRNHFRMTNHSSFAMRGYLGLGVPYGNSIALPFIKQFFVGGPNSLRGFLIREVGPGGYADTIAYVQETGEKTNTGFFNQTGDIKIELSTEIRFDIYKWLKGAVFVDAGNVWLMRKDTRALGEFNFQRFWKEFAVDAGAGIRLDFNFFVIRFDYGFPLRDPRRVEGKRWQFANGQAFKTGQFQLAIGYPF